MSSLSSNIHILTPEDEISIRKLECLKELRDVTLELSKKKARLHSALEAMDEEAKCLETFKNEKALIEQEREAHCAELLLIRDDLNQMESVIQESESETDHHLAMAKSLILEWQKLADRANKIRSALGLNQLPNLPEEEKLKEDIIKSTGSEDGAHHHAMAFEQDNAFKPLLMIANQQPMQQQPYLFPSPTSSSSRDFQSVGPHSPGMGMSSLMNPHHGPPSGLMSSGSSSNLVERSQNRSSFCQQPPPMKSCLTCFQQIHRNAPICPNCKAKSRSRNPKKPKRKPED
ncbi:zinc finger C4H2 domain-containing protein [Tetranychus urticae]|uniref:C4H2-type domain-containing protein n=1 Tax=Tetranychus urticae TaxID=32264 RepID=T1KNZ4_TETUR|nr:zinc finger C4H2 domain-containing protein [Tetranychus urticae]